MPTEVKLSGKTYQVINTLAATLTQATLKSSPAEKAAIAKEFARAFEILSKRLAEVYAKASEKLRLDIEKASDKVINDIMPSTAICCVGYPGAKSLEDCEHNGGTWACFAKPIEET
jgi:hypothetical protein